MTDHDDHDAAIIALVDLALEGPRDAAGSLTPAAREALLRGARAAGEALGATQSPAAERP